MSSHRTQNKSQSSHNDFPSPPRSASLMFLKSIRPASTSGPLHLLLPLPGMLFPQRATRLTLSPPLFSLVLSPSSTVFNWVTNPMHQLIIARWVLLGPQCLELCPTQKANNKYSLEKKKKRSGHWILAKRWRYEGCWQVLSKGFKKQTKQTKWRQEMFTLRLCPLLPEFISPTWRSMGYVNRESRPILLGYNRDISHFSERKPYRNRWPGGTWIKTRRKYWLSNTHEKQVPCKEGINIGGGGVTFCCKKRNALTL